ncbi:SRPBCC family protein [Longispora albida]|uniref:SRPBCC family protein n=1 Tax=Longispora albida TaxID=203523 RepID=UPI00036FE38C|nr:SRPBCC domain-containing protein [Longispora albida]
MKLELRRTVSAAPARVWRALTAPGELAAWFWPERLSPAAAADLRVGGRYRISGDGLAVTGEYRVVDEPSRLEFTWQWEGDSEVTVVAIELCPVAGGTGTEIVIVHTGHSDETTTGNHAQGWADCLGRLPAWLETTP